MTAQADAAAPAPGLRERLQAAGARWMFAHLDLLFAIGRNLSPIRIQGPEDARLAIVTRFDDVAEVLEHADVFDVTYAPKIREIMDGDNIFLGMPAGEEARLAKSTLRRAAPAAEAMTRVKPQTAALAETVMARADAVGRVDIAMELTQEVTTRFFGDYFGTPGRDVKTLSDQARLLFGYMFADDGHDPVAKRNAAAVAADLRAYVEGAIADRKAARGQHDDMLERCLQLQDEGAPGMDDRGIRNNLIGLMVGAMPQAPMLIPQLFDVLLDRPKELAGAQAAARADDDALLSAYVFEASRFYPLTPGLGRRTLRDYTLAKGTPRERTLPAGMPVMAMTRSAMFDGRRVAQPRAFRLDRPDSQYMHFGGGPHECFGVHMNRQMVPAICKALLKRPGLRRAAGDAGKLTLDGIFPMSLVVEWDT